jgi:hypothetical protein
VRYQLRTSAPWRAALERLRAAATVLAGLDAPDPTTRAGQRKLEQRARVLASLAWSSAPERVRARWREHLPPEPGDVDGWLAAGIVDAVAQRQPGRLDETPDGITYRQGHAAATIAMLTTVPMFDDPRGEQRPMTDRPRQPTALVSIDDAAREHGLDPQAMQQFLLSGDLSSVPPMARASLYVALCRYIGVDPIERPFLIFSDKGRTVLYAARSCTSALCRSRGISRELLGVEVKTIGGHEMAVARARATVDETGRHDEATGAVPMLQWDKGANRWREPSPDEVANTVMKAETKAKRRAVLDLVGLGIPDESEVATIRGARTGSLDLSTGDIVIEAGEPKRERAKSDATVESIRAAAARVVSLSVEPTTVEDVIEWACGKVNVPGVDDYKAPEQLAAVERYLAQAADKMAKRPKSSKPAPSSPDHAGALAIDKREDVDDGKATHRKTEALHHGHRVTERGEQSSPEHARLVARILGHAEALAGLREATVDEVMRAELRPDAAANLGGLVLADLTAIEATLADLVREESSP